MYISHCGAALYEPQCKITTFSSILKIRLSLTDNKNRGKTICRMVKYAEISGRMIEVWGIIFKFAEN